MMSAYQEQFFTVVLVTTRTKATLTIAEDPISKSPGRVETGTPRKLAPWLSGYPEIRMKLFVKGQHVDISTHKHWSMHLYDLGRRHRKKHLSKHVFLKTRNSYRAKEVR